MITASRPETIQRYFIITDDTWAVRDIESLSEMSSTKEVLLQQCMQNLEKIGDWVRKSFLHKKNFFVSFAGASAPPSLGISGLTSKVSKVKRGLASFVNGKKLSVVADTGASQNFISAAYAYERSMTMQKATGVFQLGNSADVNSIGTVLIDFAFAEERSKIHKVLCQVLSECTYDLILGSPFLRATETLTRCRHRLTQCVFSVLNVAQFSLLGNNQQLFKGTLADQHDTYALPDTGAERNVMDLEYVCREWQTLLKLSPTNVQYQ